MFEVDNVFCFISTWVDNLSASSYLEGGLFFHQVLVSWNIPLDWESKTSIALFHSTSILDFLVKFLYFVFAFFQLISIRSLSVSLEEFDVLLTQRSAHLILHLVILHRFLIITLTHPVLDI